mmetsp:Transcript_115489/g.274487  ORF Transcript_115489/g.274487 Transcript_115489/m.274487 type:complete len:499 (+) Transcript_115489:2-1498(+)
MRLGAAAALTCGWLGFPCASGIFATAFRSTCVGYFTCNVLPQLLGEGSISRQLLRAGLIFNSVSSWLVSWLWCLGFAEWCILMVLEHIFQLFAVLVLLRSNTQFHLLFTMLGSVLGYVGRREVEVQTVQVKSWVVCLVFTVFSLVAGMWFTQHRALLFLQKKLLVLYNIVVLPEEEVLDLDSLTRACSAISSSSTRSSQADLSPSAGWIDGLELGERVGQGSFGSVYYCTWRGAPAAVKVMLVNVPSPLQHADSSKSKRKVRTNPFQEAQLCAKLSHPNLVRSFQSCTRDMQAGSMTEMWIIQEWCDRGTLSAHCNISRYDPEGCRHVKGLLEDILGALCYLHKFGVIHGDLTANNVLLQSTTTNLGRDFVCKVCDFGLSRVLEEGVTELLTSQLGTVSHMPPELLQLERRSLSKKADVYAIGILLYQALMGVPPYKGMSVAQVVLYVAKGKTLSLPPDASQDLTRIFQQCTKRRPADRPEAGQLLAELRLPSLPEGE